MTTDYENHRRPWWERHRLLLLALLTALLLCALAWLAPVQLPVAVYKLGLFGAGALAGYWLDRLLFPFAQPDGYLWEDWHDCAGWGADGEPDYPVSEGYTFAFAMAGLRQAGLVCAGALAVGLGL